MSMLRKGHVALSNLRVKSPSLPFFWLFGNNYILKLTNYIGKNTGEPIAYMQKSEIFGNI